ncbi:MAG TPA: acyltransferase family protein [Acidimicrobiales bacterium]|jgi:peptidoglycan/LPS O-acetylase OafA/YrhL|nr:acyltransferase family protein [Acidimicrobiales bacterium]
MTTPTTEHDAVALAARPSATGSGRISALDGLRAVAVLIIMGFHFQVSWLPGGFIGVDVFYVLSGFLITGLLLSEYRKRGRIGLSAFWLRRARRLLPALVIVLVVVTVLVRFVSPPGLYPDFRMSSLSALFYFSNWWQIVSSGSYFVATSPASPLTHTWSLAVEEQFYLVWPLVVIAVMHVSRVFARGLRVLLVLSVVGAVGSALEMALLYNPTVNTTRLYFGTDTHAQSILVGSVLACSLTIIQMRRGQEGMAPAAQSPTIVRLLFVVGAAGFAGTLALAYSIDGTAPFDYRGGFFLSALSAAAIILAAVCAPGRPIARFLSLRLLVWIGSVSYGLYLWHYPVFVFVDSEETGLTGMWLLALRFATTFALAAASYYLVERPIMYGTFWRSIKAVGPSLAAMAAAVVVVVAGTVVPATAAVPVVRFEAHGRTPPSVVVLGDSTALTLGYALAATAPAGTTVVNGGLFGCGLAVGTNASNNPPTPGLNMFPACNSATPANQRWPALDAQAVAGTAPGDVVLFVAGNWEAQDILIDDRWTDIEEPSFQRSELSEMRKVVAIGTAHGAHFDFTTMPAMAGGAAFHEPPFPEDSPVRRTIYNRLIAQVAREFPGRVSIIDLGQVLSPHGTFTEYLNGVQVRTPDGVHTPAYAKGNPFVNNSSEAVANAFYDWVAPRLWPSIIATSGSSGSTVASSNAVKGG